MFNPEVCYAINPRGFQVAGFFLLQMLFQPQIFPTIPEWAFIGFHSLLVLSTLLSHCDAFSQMLAQKFSRASFPGGS